MFCWVLGFLGRLWSTVLPLTSLLVYSIVCAVGTSARPLANVCLITALLRSTATRESIGPPFQILVPSCCYLFARLCHLAYDLPAIAYANMPLSYSLRDASGRSISLLQDPSETPSYTSQAAYPPVAPVRPPFSVHRRDSRDFSSSSYPVTPDLMRSDSYDSQASGNGSPLTPHSAFHEPVFSKPAQEFDGYLPSLSASKDVAVRPTLPPIASFDKIHPELARRTSSYPYVTASDSSILEEFQYRPNPESLERNRQITASTLPESPLQRSVEHPDESLYHEGPLLPEPRRNEDKTTVERGSGKKASASNKALKNATLGSQKRYPCKDPNCDRTFTTSGHASRHAKIHEGSKPILCTFEGCPKRFTRQDNMKQHLETHRKDKRGSGVAAARREGRPNLAQRRQSASSKGSISRYSTPRDTPPMLSPALHSSVPLLSPGLVETGSWASQARPSISSRMPSGLDALAMVAATEKASVEQQEYAERYAYWQPTQR